MFKEYSFGYIGIILLFEKRKISQNKHSCHSLSFVVTRCHSLYHSLSFVVTCFHPLSLVVLLVVTPCHPLSLDVSLVCLFINDHAQVFFKIDVPKNVAKFTEKTCVRVSFLYEIFKNTFFYRAPAVAASEFHGRGNPQKLLPVKFNPIKM